jgi:hypothetical protein
MLDLVYFVQVVLADGDHHIKVRRRERDDWRAG